MNDSQGFESQLMRFSKISFHDILHVARRDAVEVEDVGDGNPDGVAVRPSPIDAPDPSLIRLAHLMSGDVLSAVTAQPRLDLILCVKFQLLQPDFLDLLQLGQIRSRRQILQLVGIVGVLIHQAPKILLPSASGALSALLVRFDPFQAFLLEVRLPRRVDFLRTRLGG